MHTHPDVVKELRGLFKEGSTPSRLIRHIAERHDGDDSLHALIQVYFFEAFGVPIVRGVNPTDCHQHDDLRFAFLNDQLLHEMIQRKGEWDVDGVPSWLDSLVATADREQLHSAKTVAPKPRYWNFLTPEEQRLAHLGCASANNLSEKVKILSRLCESLQQKVNDLSATPASR
jgi:hypothetical protein